MAGKVRQMRCEAGRRAAELERAAVMPTRFIRRAQQLRLMAEHTADPKWKTKMLRIADECELLGRDARTEVKIKRDLMDARWRVDFIGKVRSTLGTVEAPDQESAIAEATKQFHITPSRRNRIVVTNLDKARQD
jgi:hypothetical protein